MGDSPFIKFYPSDFLGGTSGLSPAERGVYITLLCLIYDADGPIPRDDARLSRRCGAPKAAFVRILEGLIDDGKIVVEDGMLINGRAKKAIVDRRNRTQNSTHAANQRWSAQSEKSEQNQSVDDAGAMPEQCVANASQKPEPEPDKNRDTKVSLDHLAFDEFWSIVPRKVGKGQAVKAWKAAVKKADPQTIIAAMQSYARQREGQDPQYTAHPATWLNGERWADETPAPASNFYDRIQQQLKGTLDELSRTDSIDHLDHHRLSAPVSAPDTSGRRGLPAGNRSDSRGGERAYSDLLNPRRFP